MPRKYTLDLDWCIDGENDVALSIQYNFTPGYPETGPSYSCGGEPGQAEDCEVLTVLVDGQPADEAQFDYVVCSDRLWQKMVDHVEGE